MTTATKKLRDQFATAVDTLAELAAAHSASEFVNAADSGAVEAAAAFARDVFAKQDADYADAAT